MRWFPVAVLTNSVLIETRAGLKQTTPVLYESVCSTTTPRHHHYADSASLYGVAPFLKASGTTDGALTQKALTRALCLSRPIAAGVRSLGAGRLLTRALPMQHRQFSVLSEDSSLDSLRSFAPT